MAGGLFGAIRIGLFGRIRLFGRIGLFGRIRLFGRMGLFVRIRLFGRMVLFVSWKGCNPQFVELLLTEVVMLFFVHSASLKTPAFENLANITLHQACLDFR